MHDWTLVSISFDWKVASATLELRNPKSETVLLIAKGVIQLLVPKRDEWGRSSSVNAVSGPTRQQDGIDLLLIEMQSGDVIEILAAFFDMPI